MNQETIYKHFVSENSEESIFDGTILLKIYSRGENIFVTYDGQEKILVDIIKGAGDKKNIGYKSNIDNKEGLSSMVNS